MERLSFFFLIFFNFFISVSESKVYRAFQTFAYRSICEHIRRAHPEHWIPRLPASVESFNKMIQTPPAARGATDDQGPAASSAAVQPNNNGGTVRRLNTNSSVKPRTKGKFGGSGLAS